MKSKNGILKRVRKIFTDPSFFAFILLCFYGLVIYPGCILDSSGLGIADEPDVSDNRSIPPPDGCAGEYYSYDLHSNFDIDSSAADVEFVLSLLDNPLPSGLELDPISGIISGVLASGVAEDYDFEILVTDSDSPFETPQDRESFHIRVNDFSITTNSLPPICSGSTYSEDIFICGGQHDYVWTIDEESWSPGELPLVFSITGDTTSRENTLTGNIPADTSANTYSFSVTVMDASGGDPISKRFDLLVTDELRILSPQSLSMGFVDRSYSTQLQACGGTPLYSWLVIDGALPAGLRPLNGNGTISGTPVAADVGSHSFTASVTDSTGIYKEKDFNITILASALEISSGPLSPLSECIDIIPFYINGVSGGIGEQYWEIVEGYELPPGIELSSSGILSGRPTTPNLPDGSTVRLNFYDATTGPHDPYGPVEMIFMIHPNPADSGVNVVNIRQWSADPSAAEYYPDRLNRIYLSVVDRLIKVDCTIADAAWGVRWWESPRRQATLTIVGNCMGGEISATDFRTSLGYYIALFEFESVRLLIAAAGGVTGSPHIFRLKLNFTEPNPEDPVGERIGRSVDIEVTNEVPE